MVVRRFAYSRYMSDAHAWRGDAAYAMKDVAPEEEDEQLDDDSRATCSRHVAIVAAEVWQL